MSLSPQQRIALELLAVVLEADERLVRTFSHMYGDPMGLRGFVRAFFRSGSGRSSLAPNGGIAAEAREVTSKVTRGGASHRHLEKKLTDRQR